MGMHLSEALGVHPAGLQLRAERTRVPASNLANDSTPGYQARDIDFRASLREMNGQAQGPPFTSDRVQYRVSHRVAPRRTATPWSWAWSRRSSRRTPWIFRPACPFST